MRALRGAWFVCAVVFGTAASLFALDIRYATVDGVRWEYTVNERVGDAYVRGFSPHVKSVVVPAALDGHPVTRIDGYLVQNDTSVEVIGIPASVRYLTYGNNNNPEVSWDPKILNPDEEAKRRYLILGKDQLTDPWSIVCEGESWRYNFFQVVVEMR